MDAKMITCPGCGERLSSDMKKCPSCHGPVLITSIDEVRSMSILQTNKYIMSYTKTLAADPENKPVNMSVGLCFLNLKMYDKAQAAFDKVIDCNFDNPDAYFYAAVCLLKGKKAFLTPRPIIDKALEYINAAIMIEPSAVYYLFAAYIKHDFFARKSYAVTPDYREELIKAKAAGLSASDRSGLFALLGVEIPAALS